MSDFDKLYGRADQLLSCLEKLLPVEQPAIDWRAAIAFRWRKRGDTGFIQPVTHPHRIALAALHGIDAQKKLIDRNTRQFVQGYPANNVLLTGARGTGKSSLVKAVLNKYAAKGLRLIEVEKHDLTDLHDIVEQICWRPERFILYCDDLSFEADEPGYKALKVVLDGSIATASENVLGLCHFQSPPLDARVHAGQSQHQTYWCRNPSERIGRGENFLVGTFWFVGVVLSLRSGSIPGYRQPLARLFRYRGNASPSTCSRTTMGAGARFPQWAGSLAVRA